MKVSFGYSETLQASGVVMMLADMPATGWVFCALGLVGVAFRFGMHVQEQEKKKQEADMFVAKLAESGRAVLQAVSSAATREINELH